MEVHLSYVLAALIPILFLVYRKWTKSAYTFPPGPKGWPVFGNIFDISPEMSHIDFTRISEEFGDVICVPMAGENVVVLNSTDAVREAFTSETTRDAFAGRPDSFYVKYCDYGPSTSFIDFCDVWKKQRKFLVKTLKIFDDPYHRIEATIRDQLMETVNKIRGYEGRPFDLKDVLLPSLTNILLTLVTGKEYTFDDPETKVSIEFQNLDNQILTGQIANILTWFPFLRHLPFGYGKLYREHKRSLNQYLHYMYELQKKEFEPSAPRGFLGEMFRMQSDNAWLTDDAVRGIVRESLSAGLGTTRTSLLAFFLIILHKPEVMRRIQNEIDAVIGREERPDLSHRSRMIYTEAASLELLRYVTVVPLNLPHTTTRDVKFRDYVLPKNCLVFSNQWAVHHDVTVWGDPWEYRPERFLDQDGHLVSVDSKIRRSWIPFGVGRRSCLGETFARSRIFLFISTLLQQFDFRPCADETLPSHDPRKFDHGIVLRVPKYNVCVFPRQ